MRGYLNLFWVLVQVSRLPEAALGTLTAHIRANINGVYWIILTVLDGESADVRRYRIVHSLGSDFMKISVCSCGCHSQNVALRHVLKQ